MFSEKEINKTFILYFFRLWILREKKNNNQPYQLKDISLGKTSESAAEGLLDYIYTAAYHKNSNF